MVIEVRVPKMGLVLEDVGVNAVLVTVGDRVSAGQPLVEVEGDKSTFEVESDDEGVVAEVHVSAGESVAVGGLLLTLDPA